MLYYHYIISPFHERFTFYVNFPLKAKYNNFLSVVSMYAGIDDFPSLCLLLLDNKSDTAAEHGASVSVCGSC